MVSRIGGNIWDNIWDNFLHVVKTLITCKLNDVNLLKYEIQNPRKTKL